LPPIFAAWRDDLTGDVSLSSSLKPRASSLRAGAARAEGAAWLVLAAWLVAWGSPCPAENVSVRIGEPGAAASQVADAPNLPPSTGPVEVTPVASGPLALPALAAGASVPAAPPVTGAARRLPHLARPAVAVTTGPAGAPAALDAQLNPAPLPVVSTLAGSQGGSFTASGDGTLVLEPCLRTWDGASMVVRLFDASGAEVRFDGKSLLEWRRPDDKALAPLTFQGRSDRSSMELVQSGDYTPRNDLRYSLPVKAGQRVVVEIGGEPESSSFLKLRSDVLGAP
jgi:hypothetical protein